MIVEGEPLYLDHLIQGNHQPIAYNCNSPINNLECYNLNEVYIKLKKNVVITNNYSNNSMNYNNYNGQYNYNL